MSRYNFRETEKGGREPFDTRQKQWDRDTQVTVSNSVPP